MAVVQCYYCRFCDAEAEDVWSDNVPVCCSEKMRVDHSKSRVTNFEWGQPRQYIHLRDEPFNSRSELADYAKKKKLMLGPSSEKVGGARNDMYDGVGKLFSYKNSPKGTNKLYSSGVQRSGVK